MAHTFRPFIIYALLATIGGLGMSVTHAQRGNFDWPIIDDTEVGGCLAPPGLPKSLELTLTVRPKAVIDSGSVSVNFEHIVDEYTATLDASAGASRREHPAEIENGVYHALTNLTHWQHGERLIYLLAYAATMENHFGG